MSYSSTLKRNNATKRLFHGLTLWLGESYLYHGGKGYGRFGMRVFCRVFAVASEFLWWLLVFLCRVNLLLLACIDI